MILQGKMTYCDIIITITLNCKIPETDLSSFVLGSSVVPPDPRERSSDFSVELSPRESCLEFLIRRPTRHFSGYFGVSFLYTSRARVRRNYWVTPLKRGCMGLSRSVYRLTSFPNNLLTFCWCYFLLTLRDVVSVSFLGTMSVKKEYKRFLSVTHQSITPLLGKPFPVPNPPSLRFRFRGVSFLEHLPKVLVRDQCTGLTTGQSCRTGLSEIRVSLKKDLPRKYLFRTYFPYIYRKISATTNETDWKLVSRKVNFDVKKENYRK